MSTWPHVGDTVPELVRTIELADMVAYAGATWDWHRMHYDSEYLAEHGLARPVIDGQVFGALLVATVQNWLGPEAFVRTLEFRFASLAYAGETVRCTGEVTAADDDVITITLRVEVVGDDARVTVGPATASVGHRP